jgi:hypothetical protein
MNNNAEHQRLATHNVGVADTVVGTFMEGNSKFANQFFMRSFLLMRSNDFNRMESLEEVQELKRVQMIESTS